MLKLHHLYLLFRYLGQNENKELQEKFIDIELDIEFANEERDKHEAKMDVIMLKEKPIQKSLLELTGLLTGIDHSDEPSEVLIDICHTEIEQLLRSLAGQNLRKLSEEMDEIGFKPIGSAFDDNFRFVDNNIHSLL